MAKKRSGKPIPKVEINKKYSSQEKDSFLQTLKERFEQNMHRHEDLSWDKIKVKLEANPDHLASLFAMESTEGEPDIVRYDTEKDVYTFMDCSEQSPARRSICYDGEAEAERIKKGVYPGGNAVDLATAMGIELLSEDDYLFLQELGEFDTKTESWLKTPAGVRELGGAIYGNRRYDRVFIGHNSAPSFYGARGFRGLFKL